MTEESHLPATPFSGPLFVVGMWRSGTSLLYSLLNQHPQIALTYETDLLFLRPLFSRQGSHRDWLARWEFWSSALSRHHIPIDRMPASVPDLATGALAIWKEYAGSAVMGEKSPNCFDCLQTPAREFPGARFIVIWRDIADICRSMVLASAGSSFFSKPGILHRAIIGSHKLKLECEALLRQKVPLHEIQYEEMIDDPTKVMMGICNFLGLPFDPRMATLQGSDRSSIYPSPTTTGSRAKRSKVPGNATKFCLHAGNAKSSVTSVTGKHSTMATGRDTLSSAKPPRTARAGLNDSATRCCIAVYGGSTD